jgi:hypothetical protein
MWSTRHGRWTEICFRACSPEEVRLIEPGELGVLQEAEQRFLAAAGNTTDSPYIYGLATAELAPVAPKRRQRLCRAKERS